MITIRNNLKNNYGFSNFTKDHDFYDFINDYYCIE